MSLTLQKIILPEKGNILCESILGFTCSAVSTSKSEPIGRMHGLDSSFNVGWETGEDPGRSYNKVSFDPSQVLCRYVYIVYTKQLQIHLYIYI